MWREAHVKVKKYKAPQLRKLFRNWDVEKAHAAVARSAFPSENVQKTWTSERFWKLRCLISARSCGAKHIWKSNDHFWKFSFLLPGIQSQTITTHTNRNFWKVRMWFRMAGARDSAPCQKGAEREGYVAVSKQKGLLPALKSPFVCIYSLFFVDILHDLIYVFCCPCTSLFYLEMQTGLLWARKRQFVSPNTLHDIKPYWPFAVHT